MLYIENLILFRHEMRIAYLLIYKPYNFEIFYNDHASLIIMDRYEFVKSVDKN